MKGYTVIYADGASIKATLDYELDFKAADIKSETKNEPISHEV